MLHYVTRQIQLVAIAKLVNFHTNFRLISRRKRKTRVVHNDERVAAKRGPKEGEKEDPPRGLGFRGFMCVECKLRKPVSVLIGFLRVPPRNGTIFIPPPTLLCPPSFVSFGSYTRPPLDCIYDCSRDEQI